MTNRLEEIPISFDHHAPPSHLEAMLSDAVSLRQAFYDRRGDDRIPAFTGTDPFGAWSMLNSVRAQVSDCGDQFCEWGSGLGIVTCVAEVLGWQARGFEIDPRLVESADTFARKHGYRAIFHQGSYRADGVDEALNPDIFDTDIIFAYTWPAEKEAVTEIVRQSAKAGTLFVRYLGGAQMSVFRVKMA